MKTLLPLLMCSVLPALHAGPFFFGQQGAVAASGVTALTPLQISVSCLQYLRAEYLAENGGTDGSAVATWTDEANAYDATQATAAKRPILKTALYGGNAAVRFDGIDDIMTFSSVASKSCWMVVKGNSWSAQVSYVSAGTGRGWLADLALAPSTSGPGGFDSTNLRNASAANRMNTTSLHTVLATDTKVFVDGVEVSAYYGTDTVGTVAVTQLATRPDFIQYYGFDLIEVALFDGIPTITDLAGLQAWAEGEYGPP